MHLVEEAAGDEPVLDARPQLPPRREAQGRRGVQPAQPPRVRGGHRLVHQAVHGPARRLRHPATARRPRRVAAVFCLRRRGRGDVRQQARLPRTGRRRRRHDESHRGHADLRGSVRPGARAAPPAAGQPAVLHAHAGHGDVEPGARLHPEGHQRPRVHQARRRAHQRRLRGSRHALALGLCQVLGSSEDVHQGHYCSPVDQCVCRYADIFPLFPPPNYFPFFGFPRSTMSALFSPTCLPACLPA